MHNTDCSSGLLCPILSHLNPLLQFMLWVYSMSSGHSIASSKEEGKNLKETQIQPKPQMCSDEPVFISSYMLSPFINGNIFLGLYDAVYGKV